MNDNHDRVLSALGMALAGAGVTLQSIGIAAANYQLEIQIVAALMGASGMFLQAITRPVSAFKKSDTNG